MSNNQRYLIITEKSQTELLLAFQKRFGYLCSDFECMVGGGDNSSMTKAENLENILSKIDDPQKENVLVVIDFNYLAIRQIKRFQRDFPHQLVVLNADEQEDLYPLALIQEFFQLHYNEYFDPNEYAMFKDFVHGLGLSNEVKLDLGRYVGERMSQLQFSLYSPELYTKLFGHVDFKILSTFDSSTVQLCNLKNKKAKEKQIARNIAKYQGNLASCIENNSNQFDFGDRKTVITIGNFDGVHAGHQYILSKVVNTARTQNAQSIVLTFDPHPSIFFNKNYNFQYLASLNARVQKIKSAGIHKVFVANFDQSFAAVTATEFVDNVLIGKFNVGTLIVGKDFCMGKNRQGNIEFLRNICECKGFEIIVVEDFLSNGKRVSSSEMRRGNIVKNNR
jgi:phosphopantetheine adenylyltransferase